MFLFGVAALARPPQPPVAKSIQKVYKVQVSNPRPAADLRLDQLVRVTGMSAVLIRAWERRYGLPKAERTEGGHRRYTSEQAELLRRAALLVRAGMRAGDAIARARSDEPKAMQSDLRSVAKVGELLLAGDVPRALDHLRGAWLAMGFEATLEELVIPALHEVGEGWADGRYTVADEHVATGVVTSWLGAVRAELPPTELGRPRYLIATPEGEDHAIAVWALELLLRLRGVASLALGSSVPTNALVLETSRLRPKGLVLSISRPSMRRSAGAVAAAVRAATRKHATVYIGGAGARAPLPEGLVLLPSTLTETADLLAR
jgi:methanogenic corrinoid protein MtbC1